MPKIAGIEGCTLILLHLAISKNLGMIESDHVTYTKSLFRRITRQELIIRTLITRFVLISTPLFILQQSRNQHKTCDT